jgi:hypothetical protein
MSETARCLKHFDAIIIGTAEEAAKEGSLQIEGRLGCLAVLSRDYTRRWQFSPALNVIIEQRLDFHEIENKLKVEGRVRCTGDKRALDRP